MLNNIELEILRFLEGLRSPLFIKIFEKITMLGEGPFAFGLIAVFYFIVDKKFGKEMFYVYSSGAHLNNTVKILVNRTRPFNKENGVEPVRKETATGYSFPSGHSESISSISTLVSSKYKKKWLYVVAIIISLLVGFSRLYLGCHYPSDVVVGLLVGLFISILLCKLYKKYNENKLYLFTILIFIPFAIYGFIRLDNDHADFFKTYGLIIGCGIGNYIENKYVNFKLEKSIITRLLRLIISLIPALVFYLGPKLIIDTSSLSTLPLFILCIFRYFMMGFILVGIGPLIFKKLSSK